MFRPAIACAIISRVSPCLSPVAPLNAYSHILRTQTINSSHQFTRRPRLIKATEAIAAMGATVIKFELSPDYPRDLASKAKPDSEIHSLTELAQKQPAYR
jgi:hypothetical protein